METAVMRMGGREPPDVVAEAAGGDSAEMGNSQNNRKPLNLISASYIAAAARGRSGATASVASAYSSSGNGASMSRTMMTMQPPTLAGGNGLVDGYHTYIDEEYLRCMQVHTSWDRDNGIIHLIPIAVVYQEDVH